MAKASIMRILTVFVATTMLLDVALAVDHTVGSPGGSWDLSTNFGVWASSQTFSVGDNLVFRYTSNHDVLEVTKSNYDSCGTSGPISTSTSSPTTIPLTAAGKRYFICGIPGHCSQGMKVEIDVVSAASGPPSTPTPPSPTPPANGPTTSSPPPPPTGVAVNPPSSAINLKMTAASILGFGFLMVMLL
ncbi:mavicyanin-like [Rutidosis leptorrhynchoides]|uniref:mavicyanin-like n=1 Tax=Rutidosis leptorrhynchoides TaxID=125765 RepID=UPI003A991EA2